MCIRDRYKGVLESLEGRCRVKISSLLSSVAEPELKLISVSYTHLSSVYSNIGHFSSKREVIMRKILVYAVLLMLICSLAACAGESAPSATAQPTALQTGANTQTNSPSAGNTLQGTQSALPSPCLLYTSFALPAA